MRIELHIEGYLADEAETTTDKQQWQIREMKNKWAPSLNKQTDWQIYIVHTSTLKHDKNDMAPINRHRYNSMAKNKRGTGRA
jgi:hypothetical protein